MECGRFDAMPSSAAPLTLWAGKVTEGNLTSLVSDWSLTLQSSAGNPGAGFRNAEQPGKGHFTLLGLQLALQRRCLVGASCWDHEQ